MANKILEQLNQPFPRDQVKEREGGGGRRLSYAEGHYIIRKLNEIFGQDGWSYSIKSITKVNDGTIRRGSGEVFTASYLAEVQLMTRYFDANGAAVYRADSDVGFGTGSDRNDPGAPHELATKGAVTDALKRCAKSLGDALGLALYDKEQANVAEAEEEKPQPAKRPEPKDDLKALHSLITATSTVVIKLGKATKDELKNELVKRYGAETKESLSVDQAKEFIAYLQSLTPKGNA